MTRHALVLLLKNKTKKNKKHPVPPVLLGEEKKIARTLDSMRNPVSKEKVGSDGEEH